MPPKTQWINNFSIQRSGYQLATPFEAMGIEHAQNILFGKSHPLFLTEYFFEWKGVDLLGAYIRHDELERLVEAITQLILERPERVERLHQSAYALNDALLKFDAEVEKKDLSQLSSRALGRLYSNHIVYQERAHMEAVTTTWFLDSNGETFSKYLLTLTEGLIQRFGAKVGVAEAFSLLTTSPRNSLGTLEEIESLTLLGRLKNDARAKKAILSTVSTEQIIARVPRALARAIGRHVKRWRWIPFGYMGPAYELDHYLGHWGGLLKSRTNINATIQKLKQRPRTVANERRMLIKKIGMDRETERLFAFAADITYLKGYRKDCSYYCFYVLDKLLKEIGRRFELGLNQMYMMSFQEVEQLCINGKRPSVKEFHARMSCSVHRFRKGSFDILSGPLARGWLDRQPIERVEIDTSDQLHGTCACPGRATGIVKIVNDSGDMAKMNNGDIMVAHTTFPALVPAMKKAGAIITEDGGITCHAAIVSRELKIPCVTGIKVATRVLKDGDRVEVDAGKGIVVILA